jgi:hypothetical protein
MAHRSVSVDHASAWVALKGSWRRASARVGGREGDGLSGCDPNASITKRRVKTFKRAGGGLTRSLRHTSSRDEHGEIGSFVGLADRVAPKRVGLSTFRRKPSISKIHRHRPGVAARLRSKSHQRLPSADARKKGTCRASTLQTQLAPF